MGFNFQTLWARVENVTGRYRQLGGPQTLDNVVALRVAPTGTDDASEQAPLRVIGDDANAAPAEPLLGVAARLQGFTGQSFYALRTQSAETVDLTDDASNVLTVAKKSERSAADVPALATIATVTISGSGAGTRNITTGITATLACDAAAAGPIVVTLTDSNDGVIWAATLAAPANGSAIVALSGLSIVGSENGDQTLAFAAAGPAGSQQTVAMTGYTTAT